MIQILHNNRCSKSRQAIAYLEDKNIDFEVIEYIKSPLTFDELSEILSKVDGVFENCIRKNETYYKEFLKNKEISIEEISLAMCEDPTLIQRPIVIKGEKAIIARPTELLDDFLK